MCWRRLYTCLATTYITMLLQCQLCSTRHASISENVRLSVTSSAECPQYGEMIEIQCNMTSENATALNDYSLQLLPVEPSRNISRGRIERADHAVVSYIAVAADWTISQNFTCVAQRGGRSVNKAVVSIGLAPPIATAISYHFIETERGMIVEVMWRQIFTQTQRTTESVLQYCLDVDAEDLDEDFAHVCPNNAQVLSVCMNDAMSGETRCRGNITYGRSPPTRIAHVISIVANNGKCRDKTAGGRFQLYKIPPVSTWGTALVLIPFPVIQLRVTSLFRRVLITWTDPDFVYGARNRFYALRWECSEASASLNTTERNVTLSDHDIRPYRPYDLCTFCVRAKIGERGPFSRDVCSRIRLEQERPSKSPTITGYESVKSARHDGTRNVSITWVLPERVTWNGILIKIVVVYRESNSTVSVNKTVNIPGSDSTEVSVTGVIATRGTTILRGLDMYSDYLVHMVACTVEGCSSEGETMLMSGETVPGKSTVPGTSSNLSIGVVIAIPLAAFILILGILLYCCRYRKRSRPKGLELPSISEPIDDNYDNPVGATPPEQYDTLDPLKST